VPAQLLFTIKTTGDRKLKYVARGDLMQESVHYITSMPSMAAIETVRMQAADWKLCTTDFFMAFTAAPVDQEDLYLELRPVPLEFEGTEERTFDPTSAGLEAACCQGWACCVVFIYWGRRRLFHSGPFSTGAVRI